MLNLLRTPACILAILVAATPVAAQGVDQRVLATNKTSTMETEMGQAGDAGFRFAAVMGGETSLGGNEVVVIMQRQGDDRNRYEYRLLATNKTSTMQRELQDAADAGYAYVGQSVFKSTFGGQQVVCILERVKGGNGPRYEYLLLATKRTSTLEKELREAGAKGFETVGMTVAVTAIGGNELVTVMRRRR